MTLNTTGNIFSCFGGHIYNVKICIIVFHNITNETNCLSLHFNKRQNQIFTKKPRFLQIYDDDTFELWTIFKGVVTCSKWFKQEFYVACILGSCQCVTSKFIIAICVTYIALQLPLLRNVIPYTSGLQPYWTRDPLF